MPRPTGYTAKRRRQAARDVGDELEDFEAAMGGDDQEAPTEQHGAIGRALMPAATSSNLHAVLAQLLWTTDFITHILQELVDYADVAVCR